METSGEWLVIINPNSGRRKGEKDWRLIAQCLGNHSIPFRNVFTHHRDHATFLTTQYLRTGFRKLIVVGGDGTLNEVVNGIFSQDHCSPDEILLGMIPVGTGNDWCRMHKIPNDYAGAAAVIAEQHIFRHDIGSVEFDYHGKRSIRYFINMAGIGFDALVAKKTNLEKDRGRGGSFSYFKNIFTSLFFHNSVHAQVKVDDTLFNSRIFSASVGICKYNGGGMKQAPDAIPDDGLFDLTLITHIPKWKVVRNAAKLFDGTYVKLPQVKAFRGESIVVDSVRPLFLEADGESLGHSPFHFNMLPGALNVIVPE